MTTDLEPTRPLTVDDVDAIIATRLAVDAEYAEWQKAFWAMMDLAYRSGISKNTIAERVHAAGLESRPTTLARLQEVAARRRAMSYRRLADSVTRAHQSLLKIGHGLAVSEIAAKLAEDAETASDAKTD
ncbi:hypothetical protein ACFVH6_21795 [Spirillospora sp. NPDC127200]